MKTRYMLAALLIASASVSSLVSAATYTGQTRHNGSMCTIRGSQGASAESCLSLTGNGAMNRCSYPITIVCPMMFDWATGYDMVGMSIYNPNPDTNPVKARVIWQDNASWYWGACPTTTSPSRGATFLFPDVCGPDNFWADYYALEVVLPTYNSRVYGYQPRAN